MHKMRHKQFFFSYDEIIQIVPETAIKSL